MKKMRMAEYIQVLRIQEELGETAILEEAQVFYNLGEVRI